MRLAVTKENRPHLTVNYKYILDKGFANESVVLLTKCLNHFCEVEDVETHERWETMTSRLSEIN